MKRNIEVDKSYRPIKTENCLISWKYKNWFPSLADFNHAQEKAREVSKKFRFTLYGGDYGDSERIRGKSYWLRWVLINFILREAPRNYCDLNCLLVTKKITNFNYNEAQQEYPSWLGEFDVERGSYGSKRKKPDKNSPPHMFTLYARYGNGTIYFSDFFRIKKILQNTNLKFAAIAFDNLEAFTELEFNYLIDNYLVTPDYNPKGRCFATAILRDDNPNSSWIIDYWDNKKYPKDSEFKSKEFKFVDGSADYRKEKKPRKVVNLSRSELATYNKHIIKQQLENNVIELLYEKSKKGGKVILPIITGIKSKNKKGRIVIEVDYRK